jgi:hypothetical protein
MNEGVSKPINVFVKFSPVMEAITGQEEMELVLSDGAPFLFLLHCIFTSFPELERRYPPGKLAISLNNHRPSEQDVLHDGDLVIVAPGGKIGL